MDEIERMKSDAEMKEEMESKLYTMPRRVTVCYHCVTEFVCTCLHVEVVFAGRGSGKIKTTCG